jgi:ABC-type lipoprotein export system ATPase subunit
MIRLVRVSYGSPRRVLQNVSLHLPRGSAGVLVGPMGSGKTLILRLCSGSLLPDDGSVLVGGSDTRTMRGRAQQRMRQATAFITTELPLQPTRTVLQNITTPLELRGTQRTRAVRAALRALDALDALSLAKAWPAELSSGERQVVVIARALAQRPLLVLVDEPMAALPSCHGERLMTLLSDLSAQGSSVLMASRDAELAPRDARIWQLRGGTVGPCEVIPHRVDAPRSALVDVLLRHVGPT